MPFKNPHPLYGVWAGMRRRCMTPTSKAFPAYGGRGISICDRWNSFAAFVADMGPRPVGYSLDRIDNDGGYSPENCRWADKKTQQRNQRRAVYVIVDGRRRRAIELAELAGVKTDTIIERAARGLGFSDVVSTAKSINVDGLALGGQANGARQRARTHCAKGHEFTQANTRVTPEGWRNCRTCHAAKMRRRNAELRSRRGQ